MKRRELLKRVFGFMVGMAVARTGLGAQSPNDGRLETVRRMATETPAQGWPSRSGHGSTLVYFGDGPVFEVRFRDEQPVISTREMTIGEADSLTRYRQKLDQHIPQRIGSAVHNGWRLRGWIYNGRHSSQWIMSAEQFA